MKKTAQILLLFALIVFGSYAQQETQSGDAVSKFMSLNFDCRRTGHDCNENGGTCNLDSGNCDCKDDYSGFTCHEFLPSVVNTSLCNNGQGCGNSDDSFCLSGENEVMKCSCSYDWFGEACDKPRFELVCTATSMTINHAPYAGSSKIYVIDNVTLTEIDLPLCTFSKPSETDIRSLSVSYEDVLQKCGGTSPDNTTYALHFIIQSDAQWLTSFDQVITARCSLVSSEEFQKVVTIDVTSGTVQRDADNRTVVVGQYVSNALENVGSRTITAQRTKVEVSSLRPTPTMSLLQEVKNGDEVILREIKDAVKIGDIVIFMITNVNETIYPAMRAEDCDLSMDKSLTASLIKDQCPASRFAWSLLLWNHTKVTNNSLGFYLRLPASTSAAQARFMTIACRVKLCTADKADQCQIGVEGGCKHATYLQNADKILNFKRKRRDSPAELTLYTTVSRTFKIITDDELEFMEKSSANNNNKTPLSLLLVLNVIVSNFMLFFPVLFTQIP